jgi:hypothetical protein
MQAAGTAGPSTARDCKWLCYLQTNHGTRSCDAITAAAWISMGHCTKTPMYLRCCYTTV